MPYRSVNPATGEVLMTFPEHTDEQVWGALAKADKAFRAWAARPFSERSKIIARSAQILLEKKEELAHKLFNGKAGKFLSIPRAFNASDQQLGKADIVNRKLTFVPNGHS